MSCRGDTPTIAMKLIHNKLLVDLHDTIGCESEAFKCIRTTAATYLQPGTLESCKNIMDIGNKMIVRGWIKEGEYEKLTKMLKDAGLHGEVIEAIKTAEREINEINENLEGTMTRRNGGIQPKQIQRWKHELKPVFVDTRGYRKAKQVLQEHNMVLVLGFVGDGKTSIAKMLAIQCVEEGHSISYVTQPKDVRKALNKLGKSVIICEDLLGKFCPDNMLEYGWMREGSAISDSTNTNSKLILTARNYVYEQCKEKLHFLEPEHIVDINNESLRLTDNEKSTMLQHHLMHHNITIEASVIEHISKNHTHLFFANCCKKWATLGKPTLSAFAECFDSLIMNEIQTMMNQNEIFNFFLKLMALNNACFPIPTKHWSQVNGIVRDIHMGATVITKYDDIRKAIHYLQGSIIYQDGNHYQFSTNCIWSQVVKDIHPSLIFKHASVSLIAKHMRGDDEGCDTRSYMVMEKEYYIDFLNKALPHFHFDDYLDLAMFLLICRILVMYTQYNKGTKKQIAKILMYIRANIKDEIKDEICFANDNKYQVLLTKITIDGKLQVCADSCDKLNKHHTTENDRQLTLNKYIAKDGGVLCEQYAYDTVAAGLQSTEMLELIQLLKHAEDRKISDIFIK